MITGTDRWYQLAAVLMAVVRDGLTTSVDSACVVPGTIAWDACDCGSVYVSVGHLYLSDEFPMQLTTAPTPNCGAAWEVVEIIIQVMRCVPVPSGGNITTTCAAETAAAYLIRVDAAETLHNVSTALCQMRNETYQIADFIVDNQTVQGPQGGCGGTELRVRIGLPRE